MKEKFRFIGEFSILNVGALIERPPDICIANIGISEGNNRLSPCGDQILFHKIWRAIEDRPYEKLADKSEFMEGTV